MSDSKKPRPREPVPRKPALQVTPDARALGLSTDSAGGFAVPFQLDGTTKKAGNVRPKPKPKPEQRDGAAS